MEVEALLQALLGQPKVAATAFALGVGVGLTIGALRGDANANTNGGGGGGGGGGDDGDDDGSEYEEEDHGGANGLHEADVVPGEVRMMLVVNTGLKMQKGKIAAQCGHATLGAVRSAERLNAKALASWEYYGAKKICVKVQDDAALLALEQEARAIGVPNYLVRDAGHTQIPAGSVTVLGLGPASDCYMDQITGHLKLL